MSSISVYENFKYTQQKFFNSEIPFHPIVSRHVNLKLRLEIRKFRLQINEQSQRVHTLIRFQFEHALHIPSLSLSLSLRWKFTCDNIDGGKWVNRGRVIPYWRVGRKGEEEGM